MRILITGNQGLIGSAIEKKFKLRHEVFGIDKKNLSSEYVSRSINLIKNKFDMIIHCASNCIIRDVIKNPRLAQENINSAFDVMELAKRTGCKKVIMFSSSRVMHKNKNPYTVSKVFNEEICKAYKECYGIDYLIIRPECVWGEGEEPIRVIPNWINKALNNEPIIVFGNKKKQLTPIHVLDFLKVFEEYFNAFNHFKGNTYQISGFAHNVDYIISTIKEVTESESKIIYMKAEKSQPQKKASKNYCGDENSFKKRIKEVI